MYFRIGFVKIRYYGILGNNHRLERLKRCRRLLGCRKLRKRRDRTIKRDVHMNGKR